MFSFNVHALHRAIEENKYRSFWKEVIRAKAAKINDQNHECIYTPLHHAIAHNKFEFMVVLLTHPLIDLDLVDQSRKTVQEMVSISPFVGEDIFLAVTSMVHKREENNKINILDFIRNRDRFYGELPAPIMAQLHDEERLTKILIDFHRWAQSKVHTQETFLRSDDPEVLALAHFLLNAETTSFLREQIQKSALKEYRIGKKIREHNVAKYEKIICDLIVVLKNIFLQSIEANRCLQRFFYSIRWICSKALKNDRRAAEERILSFIFFRFINNLLLQSPHMSDGIEKIRLIKVLQRTLSGEYEKGGDLEILGDFFAGNNKLGEEARVALTIFRKIFYREIPQP